jgi:hypothetical protein
MLCMAEKVTLMGSLSFPFPRLHFLSFFPLSVLTCTVVLIIFILACSTFTGTSSSQIARLDCGCRGATFEIDTVKNEGVCIKKRQEKCYKGKGRKVRFYADMVRRVLVDVH